MAKEVSRKTVELLYVINRLNQKAYQAESREALSFVILNDTIRLVHYDRAVLLNLEEKNPQVEGISGQSSLDKKSVIAQKWIELYKQIQDPSKPQILNHTHFASRHGIWDELQGKSNTVVLWIPIIVDQKLKLGLWIELWTYKADEEVPDQSEQLHLLSQFLAPVYGIVWGKLHTGVLFHKVLNLNLKQWIVIFLLLSLFLFGIRVPIRVVAPAEVVPNDPYIVAAPLDGIVEKVLVEPGQEVKQEEPLFEYDKNVPLQELKIAEKQVEITSSELNRAINLGHEDPEARSEVAILHHKLKRDQVALDLARYHASLLTVTSPIEGVVVMSNPDEWRGRSVVVGEKVMEVTDPKNTKVRIWIPESDNVWINPEEEVKVILNVRPSSGLKARLLYVANVSEINEQDVASFEAEAEWVDPPENLRLGLKGTALLYGEKVSLFYFLFRKPWAATRYYLGI